MNIARAFSYTRQIETERNELKTELERERVLTRELFDAVVFNRMPRRLMEFSEPAKSESPAQIPEKPPNMDDAEYREWLEKLAQADPLTRADMLAEIEEG